jgi:hypothetical protein
MRALALRHPAAAGFVLFALLAGLSRPQSWRKPLEPDTGQYLYVADVMLHGGTPYVDAANNKGPLTYLLFVPISLIGDTHAVVVRMALLVFAALAALAVAGYVTHHAGRAAGAVAGFALALLASASAMAGDDPNTAQFGIAPMAGAWYLATRGTARASAAAGALAAAATLMNPAFAVVLPFVAWELWRAGGRRPLALGAAGGGAVAVVVLGWIVLAGALDDMADQVLEQAVRTATRGIPTGSVLERGDERGVQVLLSVPAPGLWIAGLLGCAVAATDRRLRAPAIASALWIVVALLRVKLATYGFRHHYYPGLVGIAAGIGLGLAVAWRRVEGRPGVALAVVALAALWIPSVAVPQLDLLELPPEQRRIGDPAYSEQYPVAGFLAANTEPGDRVQVAGIQAQVYWLARRRSPTRFFDPYFVERRRDDRAAFLDGLLADPPAAIAALPREAIRPEIAELMREVPYRVAYDVRGCRVWLRADA